MTELIGKAPDAIDEDVELMQKKVDADLNDIVERILLQNSHIIDDNCADQIDFATFLEIYTAIGECKSSRLSNSQSIPTSPAVACGSAIKFKRIVTEDVDETAKKARRKCD